MPPETDNLLLQELYQADQKDREKVYDTAASVTGLKKNDTKRRGMVGEMMSQGQVNTANDLYHAGVIFLHGEQSKDFLTAHRLSTLAAIMGHKPARWLTAASLDRFLVTMGQPQIYGTQFEHNSEENRYQLRLPLDDSNVLSFEKRYLNVPAVMDRLVQLNRRITAK